MTEQADGKWRTFDSCLTTRFPFRRVATPLRQSDRFEVCLAQQGDRFIVQSPDGAGKQSDRFKVRSGQSTAQ
jgi:hypothetical protein